MDRALKPEVAAFFPDDPFQAEGNVFVAWAGMHAPAGTRDLEAYGRRALRGDVDREHELRFEGDVSGICYEQARMGGAECLGIAGIQALARDNKELLRRYRNLYHGSYQSYSVGDLFWMDGVYYQDAIKMQQVLAAGWIDLARRGRGDLALQEWALNMRWLQAMLSGKNTMIGQAVLMVTYGIHLGVLPVLLDQDDALLEQYEPVLTKLLMRDFFAIWDVKKTMQAEYNIWDVTDQEVKQNTRGVVRRLLGSVFYKSNDTRNKFYEFARDSVALSEVPPAQLSSAVQRYKSQYDQHYDCTSLEGFLFCFPNITGNLLLGGILKGQDLFMSGHKMTARHWMLLLWMKAKRRGVAAADMAAFLQESDPVFYNPFTDAPFEWDAEKRSIRAAFEEWEQDLYYSPNQ